MVVLSPSTLRYLSSAADGGSAIAGMECFWTVVVYAGPADLVTLDKLCHTLVQLESHTICHWTLDRK